MQNQANAQFGAQLGSGVGVFNEGSLNGELGQQVTIYIQVQENQLGRPEVSISLGSARIFLPQQTRTSDVIKSNGAEPHTAAGEAVPQSVVLPGVQAEQMSAHLTNATAALSFGRELVFHSSQDAVLPQSLIPSRTGDAPVAGNHGNVSRETSQALIRQGRDPGGETGSTARVQVSLAVPSAAIERVPQAVRELLTQLQLLPPGTHSDDVLPRLQEVVRLWQQEASQNSKLPPDVVRVVNHFLASAVLSVALADPKTQTSSNRPDSPLSARPEARDGASIGNPLFASLTPNLTQISGTRIAEAVMNLLSGTQPQTQTMPQVKPQSVPQASPARPEAPPLPQQQAHRAPSLGPSAPLGGQSGIHAEPMALTAKGEGMVRLDAAGRPLTREEVREQRSIPRTDVHPEIDQDRPVETPSQGSYEREAHSETAYDGNAALEVLWPRLVGTLQAAGYLDQGSIRRLRDAADGAILLNLISTFVPDGFDLIDVMELIRAKIGWSENRGFVNETLGRTAGYRMRWRITKEGALMEPVQDVMMLLGFGFEPASDEEMGLLRRFEAHAPLVEAFSDHAAWVASLDDKAFKNPDAKQETIANDLAAARGFFQDFANRHALPAVPAGPVEMPRLLN